MIFESDADTTKSVVENAKLAGIARGGDSRYYIPPAVKIDGAANSKEWNRRRRAAYLKMGLNSRGEPYKQAHPKALKKT